MTDPSLDPSPGPAPSPGSDPSVGPRPGPGRDPRADPGDPAPSVPPIDAISPVEAVWAVSAVPPVASVAPVVTVYWRPGCPYCSGLFTGLGRSGLAFERVNIWDDPDAAGFVRRHADGNETVPTVAVAGEVLVNPPVRAVLAAARAAGVPAPAPPGAPEPVPSALTATGARSNPTRRPGLRLQRAGPG